MFRLHSSAHRTSRLRLEKEYVSLTRGRDRAFLWDCTLTNPGIKASLSRILILFTFYHITENLPKLSLIIFVLWFSLCSEEEAGPTGGIPLPYLKLTMLTRLQLWYLPFCPSTDLFKATIIEQHIVLDICTVTGLCRVSVSGPQYCFSYILSFLFSGNALQQSKAVE